MLRLRSMPSDALLAQWRELGLPLESTDIAPNLRIAGESDDGAAALHRLPLHLVAADRFALAEARDGTAVAAAITAILQLLYFLMRAGLLGGNRDD